MYIVDDSTGLIEINSDNISKKKFKSNFIYKINL